MTPLRLATIIHASLGTAATIVGLLGIANGLREHHIPRSDWSFFIVLAATGPLLALWTYAAERHATGPKRRLWSVPRAVVAVVFFVLSALLSTGSASLASTGGVGALYFVGQSLAGAFAAFVEALVIVGVYRTRPSARSAHTP